MPNREVFHLAHKIRMSAEDSESAELMLWGEIIPDLPKYYKEQYPNDKSSSDFDRDIKELREKGVKKLLMRINSPGGIVTESVAMRSILANAGFEEINIRIEGLCASAATNIATLPGAHVQIAEGSEYMIHNPWTYAFGNANDMEHVIDRLRSMEKTSRSFYAAKTGQSDEQLKTWMDAEKWFTAEEAVEYGFADELLKAEETHAEPVAACVSSREMAAMRSLYRAVPKEIRVREEPSAEENVPAEGKEGLEELARCAQAVNKKSGGALTTGKNASPVAGETSANTEKEEPQNMEIKDLTREQLASENPALVDEIVRQAVEAERERVSGIDAVTMPGYEADAEAAKQSGASVADFIKSVVQKSRQKGTNFLAARQEETAPAQTVTAGAAEDKAASADEEEDKAARMVAEEAAAMIGGNSGMF